MNLRVQALFWLGALVFLLLFLWVFSGILLPFIMGMALAYLLDPIADRLERAGMSRFWATITIVVLSVLVFALVALIGIPLLVGQLSAFLEKLPVYAAELQALGDRFFETRVGQYFKTQDGGPSVDQIVTQGASWAATVLASVWAGGQALISVVSLVVVTPVVAFYLLYDWDRMIGAHRRAAAARTRRDDPRARPRGQRGDRRLHPRAGRGLPAARPFLRDLALRGRAEFRLPDRLARRRHQLHPLCRLDRRLLALRRRGAGAVLAGLDLDRGRRRHLRGRAVHGRQHPAAAPRRVSRSACIRSG